MSSLRSDQINRVKIITSKFECLNGQTSNQAGKRNFNRDSNVQKIPLSRIKSDTRSESHTSHQFVINESGNQREKFDSSYNFGNRKRLKDHNENNTFERLNERLDLQSENIEKTTGSKEFKNITDTIENPSNEKQHSNGKLLVRQYSDPAKKLHRSPAFRCDRSEKIRENSSKSVHKSPDFNREPESCLNRDKLKKLGSMIEERLKEDELAFSGMHSKANGNKKISVNSLENKIADENVSVNKYEKSEESIDDILLNEMKNNDSNIPQHILDMYAKVLKPKNRQGIFSKIDILSKIDGVFSDSGVSSESENLISDDLDDSKLNNDGIIETINDAVRVDKENLEFITNEAVNTTFKNSSLSIDEEVLKNNDALKSGLISRDTLKKILKQPLPDGPPPKKPPRTFTTISSKIATKQSSNKIQNESKFRPKTTNSKDKSHRSREESKLMLEKIENAFNKHKSTGKILSPRLGRIVQNESNISDERVFNESNDSISKKSTLPLNSRLRQTVKNKNNNPKEIHYMCTEILDLNFSDQNHSLNLSNGSVSSEDLQPSNSFTKCLNSLNCVSNNGHNDPSIFYTKFGTESNSTSTSFIDACCYCNLRNGNNCNEQSDSGMRLSTFQNPITNSNQNTKCKRCNFNDVRQNNFKCHLDCKCTDDDVSGNSTFFVDNESGNCSQYGALIKSRSQEHIYDEPTNVIPKRLKDDEISNECLKRTSFTRSATQLEDAFQRFRTNTLTNDRQNYDCGEFVRNDFKSKTLNRISTYNKESKLKNILRGAERKGNSLKTSFLNNFAGERNVLENDNIQNGITNISKTKQLHYMCSNIYDVPPVESDTMGNSSINEDNSTLPFLDTSGNHPIVDDSKKNNHSARENANELIPNASSLYEIGSKNESLSNYETNLLKKPPLCEKKINKDVPSGVKRPQNLNLGVDRISKVALLRKKFNGPVTEEEKRNLDRLMTEIYDTVTAECLLESPNKDVKTADNEGASKLIVNDREMSEASLKLTRSLTEKRKRYVRRVTSKVELIPPNTADSIKRIAFHNSLKLHQDKPVKNDFTKSLPLTYDFKKVRAVFDSVNKESAESTPIDVVPNDKIHEAISVKDGLFEACALIAMNLSTGQAVIKSVFPENAVLPPQIECLVFPESVDNNEGHDSTAKQYKFELMAEDCQTYSLVLTDEHGRRNYGYCRRVVPEGAPFCLPLAYCIISPYRVPAFYYKVLSEIEIHHGSSESVVKSILEQLYKENLPKPGNFLSIKPDNSLKRTTLNNFKKNSLYRSSVNLGDVLAVPNNQTGSTDYLRRKSTDLSQKFPDVFSGRNSLSMVQSLEKIFGEEVKKNKENNTLSVNIIKSGNIKRATSDHRVFDDRQENNENKKDDHSLKIPMPLEPRLEEDNLSVLYDSISVSVLVKIFGTLLLERKVIIVSDKLSQLSSCIEALQLILYPFIWQHTIISTIPSYLRRDLLEAPIPILAGVLCSKSLTNVKRKRSDCDNKNREKPSRSENSNDFTIDDFYEEVKSLNFEEGMIVDITPRDKSPSEKIIKLQGDESTLLPPMLSKTLSAALKLGPSISAVDAKSDNHARKSRNILIAEAFLRFFIVLLEDYPKFLNPDDASNSTFYTETQNMIFNKENFIKNASSKHVQYFLEWFTETAMFSNFINNKILPDDNNVEKDFNLSLPYPDFYSLFDDRIILLMDSKKKQADLSKNSKIDSNSNVKSNYKGKIKTWRAKLKDLIN